MIFALGFSAFPIYFCDSCEQGETDLPINLAYSTVVSRAKLNWFKLYFTIIASYSSWLCSLFDD